MKNVQKLFIIVFSALQFKVTHFWQVRQLLTSDFAIQLLQLHIFGSRLLQAGLQRPIEASNLNMK